MMHQSIRIIREEHATLASIVKSLGLMVERGPGHDLQGYFDVVRAMLFYIDEFPEKLHHPKESQLLFPKVAQRAPEVSDLTSRLDREHEKGEHAIRELQHQLLSWELLGDSHRSKFEETAKRYQAFYLEHMYLEESVVLPAALKVLTSDDWAEIDAAFATNTDPLNGKYVREPMYDKLFSRIVTRAPAPIGLGEV